MSHGQPLTRRAVLRAGLLSLGAACAMPDQVPPAPSPTTDATSPPAPTATPTTSATPSPAPDQVALLCRDAWGAREPATEMTPHTIDRITVHHTAVVADDPRRGPDRMREFQAFHMDQRGWPDVAYHLGIDQGGHLYDLRPWDRRGDTATAYDPTGHFLVLADGNFDQQDPTPAQLAALVDVLTWAADRFDVGLDTVTGHRDHAITACPGDGLYARIDELVEGARRAQDAGGVRLERACGATGRDAVSAIESGAAP